MMPWAWPLALTDAVGCTVLEPRCGASKSLHFRQLRLLASLRVSHCVSLFYCCCRLLLAGLRLCVVLFRMVVGWQPSLPWPAQPHQPTTARSSSAHTRPIRSLCSGAILLRFSITSRLPNLQISPTAPKNHRNVPLFYTIDFRHIPTT